MATVLKIFIGFWIIWIIWYLTGGPLRDDKNKPFVRYDNSTNQIESVSTTSVR